MVRESCQASGEKNRSPSGAIVECSQEASDRRQTAALHHNLKQRWQPLSSFRRHYTLPVSRVQTRLVLVSNSAPVVTASFRAGAPSATRSSEPTTLAKG